MSESDNLLRTSLSEKICSQLDVLRPSSEVAVITYVGSFCPITVAHVLCMVETKKLIMNELSEFPCAMPRPRIEPPPALVIAYISVNRDTYVESKMQRMGEVAISANYRRMLIDLAVEDISWICSHTYAWAALEELKIVFPRLRFIHYEVDGADVALKNCVWRHCSDRERRVAMGRACADSEPNPTQEIIARAQEDGVNFEAGHFLIGPELPDISSSRARACLRAGNIAALRNMLHPRVLDWNLSAGPYKPSALPRSRSHLLLSLGLGAAALAVLVRWHIGRAAGGGGGS
jgi:hypothetical protein